MYYLAQGITHRGVGGAYISAEENHPPCARISPPGLPTSPRPTFAPRSTALSIHLLAAHSRPPPPSRPLTTRRALARLLAHSFTRSLPFSFSLFPPFRFPRFAVPPQSPTYSVLFALPPPSAPARFHPPKTPLDTHPTLLSTLYQCSTVTARRPPIPFAAASIRRSDSPQRQPPAEGGCALLAPESSRPRPRRGKGRGEGGWLTELGFWR